MKKLNITAVEYQHKVRQLAKARTIKFRKEQEKRGYKNLTIYLSEKFRDELKSLSEDQGLNRQAAMDYIFDIYHQNSINCVTSNVILDIKKTAKSLVNVESVEKPLPQELNFKSKTIHEKQNKLFSNMPGSLNSQEYRKWLFEQIDNLQKVGIGWAEITKKLNTEGIKSISGKEFRRGAVQTFYKRELKKKNEPLNQSS